MRFLAFLCIPTLLSAASPYPEKTPSTPGNILLDRYFAEETRQVEESGGLGAIKKAEDWTSQVKESRRQLAEMLGLDPMPEKTPLNAVKTGEVKGDGYKVEKMHFQALPGLYVTCSLYVPDKVEKPLPTILYVCGHALVQKDGVSFGNKTGYQHHGTWYARHGYVCLIIDTVELGEIRGEHHGTFSKGRWWWWSRGYTPAGLEALAGMRALDYLETRSEVDKTNFGVSGRSGGGAYSWYIAALDERVKAAAPTAGITTLRNHVVDGCVEGHCDCMFFQNTYRWDHERVAALVAPRALLICNTDKDPIFPVGGVFRIYQETRRLYELLGVEANIGLHIAEGPHKDLQPLNTGEFHWFERFLKKADPMAVINEGASKAFEPAELRVFQELPKDERNTRIDESFVPKAAADPVVTKETWPKQKETWMSALREKVFAGWPKDAVAIQPVKENSIERDGIRMTAYDIETQPFVRLRVYVAHREGLRLEDLELVALNVLNAEGWQHFCDTYETRFSKLIETFPVTKPDQKAFESEKKMFENFKWGMAYVCPRGIGPTEWTGSEKAQVQRLRRFYLLGQTVDGMRVWDIRRSIEGVRQIEGLGKTPLWLQAQGEMAVNVLYASLFEDNIKRLDLHEMPTSHETGPAYFNVLKFLDIPTVVALASERYRTVLYTADKKAWDYSVNTAKELGWEKQLQLRDLVEEKKE